MFKFFKKKKQDEPIILVITPAIQELSDSALALGSSPAAVDYLIKLQKTNLKIYWKIAFILLI